MDLSSPPVFRRTISVLFYVFKSIMGYVCNVFVTLERTGSSNGPRVTIRNSKVLPPCNPSNPQSLTLHLTSSMNNNYATPLTCSVNTNNHCRCPCSSSLRLPMCLYNPKFNQVVGPPIKSIQDINKTLLTITTYLEIS